MARAGAGGGEGALLFSPSSEEGATFDELAALCRLDPNPDSASSSSPSSSPFSAWPGLSRAMARNRRGRDDSCSSFARELLEALASTSEEKADARPPRPARPPTVPPAAAADADDDEDGSGESEDCSPSTALLLRRLEEARELAARHRRRELRWREAALTAEAALDEALEAAAAAAAAAGAKGGGGGGRGGDGRGGGQEQQQQQQQPEIKLSRE